MQRAEAVRSSAQSERDQRYWMAHLSSEPIDVVRIRKTLNKLELHQKLLTLLVRIRFHECSSFTSFFFFCEFLNLVYNMYDIMYDQHSCKCILFQRILCTFQLLFFLLLFFLFHNFPTSSTKCCSMKK